VVSVGGGAVLGAAAGLWLLSLLGRPPGLVSGVTLAVAAVFVVAVGEAFWRAGPSGPLDRPPGLEPKGLPALPRPDRSSWEPHLTGPPIPAVPTLDPPAAAPPPVNPRVTAPALANPLVPGPGTTEPTVLDVAVPGGRWWELVGQAPAAQPPPAAPPLVPAPPLSSYDSPAQVVQCRRCGGFRVKATLAEDRFDLRCLHLHCGEQWSWRRGQPWPVTTMRPPRRPPPAQHQP
jgi:hypothetical protein